MKSLERIGAQPASASRRRPRAWWALPRRARRARSRPRPSGAHSMISGLAEGRTETPQTRKMLAPTGAASSRIAMKKGHQTRSKKPKRRTFWIAFGRVAGRRASFSGVAVFRVIPEHPTGLTDDDATTTTRNAKPASYAPARPVPRVRRVCDGHGGAVVVPAYGKHAFAVLCDPRSRLGAACGWERRRSRHRGMRHAHPMMQLGTLVQQLC